MGGRWYDRSQLVEVVTYHWSSQEDKYVEQGNRIDFAFGAPELHEYPEQAAFAYYLAIDAGRYSEAYSYLSPSFQAAHPFEEFRTGFATTRKVNVNKLEVRGETATVATIAVRLTGWDEVGGKLSPQRFSGGWLAEKQGGEWKLAQAGISPEE